MNPPITPSRRLRALMVLATLAWATPLAADVAPSLAADTPVEPPAVAGGPGMVLLLRWDDHVVNRGTARWLVDALADAGARPEVRGVLVELDTPGGVLQDTRELVKAMLGSTKPVLFWVGPSGARAASAGVFMTVAAHVAGMAPSTHIGAAHPVMLGPRGDGEDGGSEAAMLEKVTNDTVAWAKGLATRRGRNADWVERAVRDSVSVTAEEALDLGVIDGVWATPEAMLAAADGRIVDLAGVPTRLDTVGWTLSPRPMRTDERVLAWLTDPTVAYLLLVIGLAGLWLEWKMPGTFVPAAIGGTCLLLFGFSVSALPVNLLAVLFVVLGFGLIVAELFVTSFGLLATAGVLAVVFGGVFLIDASPSLPRAIPLRVPIAVGVLLGGLVAAVLALVIGDRRRASVIGVGAMVGARATVIRRLPGGRGVGQVRVHGELWSASSPAPIESGVEVVVQSVDGLRLEVLASASAAPAPPSGGEEE